FFQAEDGIRGFHVTGVQTCALPIFRDYPSKANAAHVLGYLGDGQGRSGLEAEYDEALRGQQGEAKQVLTRDGGATEEMVAAPQDGQRLLTTLDLDTQVVAERALRDAVDAARDAGYRATGGSVIVMDVRTGAIRAVASYPTYDPNIWAQGLTDAQYAELTDESGGRPLVFRPIQALMPPASTFKSLTTVAADEAGFDRDGTYQCPSALVVGGQTFRNYESRAYGPVSLAQALSVSCDTVFYRLGYQMWKRDG